jgi:RNA polymerase sigma factor (sigma-70 family)
MDMPGSAFPDVLWYIRHLVGTRAAPDQGDGALLQQFVAGRDEGAFAALLQRHGPLVWGVCRRVLGDAHDVEDAFQATFLVLARKAASIRKHESLAAWLHRVALNIARTARAATAQRQAHEREAALMSQPNPVDEAVSRDWQPLLHEELDRLPEKYRLPVLLCYLEGKTHEAAARQLGWPLGTVKGRLARARDLLRARLARRGLALTVAGIGAALAPGTTEATVPPALLGHTLRAAGSFAGGGAAGGASAPALALAQGALRTMTTTKVVPLIVLMFTLGAVGFGAVLGHGRGREAGPETPVAAEGEAPPASGEGAAPAPAEPGAKAAEDFGDEVKGLRARVTLAKKKFLVGEAIPAKYVVKNVSKEEQTVWHSGFWPNHQVIVKDADGKEPPLSEFGKERRKAFSPGGERSKNSPVTIPPGGEDAAYEKYDLTQLYDLAKSGRYTVQYIYEEKQGGWEGRLPSNEATFEFDAAEKKERTAEKDGVRFELLVPDTAWTIPENKAGAESPVALGLRITNTTKKSYRFSAYETLFPEVRGPDGKEFQYEARKLRTALKKAADCPLVEPGASVILMLDATLSRMPDDHVRLRGRRPSNPWVFLDDVKPGRYKVRVSYQNDDEQFKTDVDKTVLKDVWTGDVPTPFVEVTVTGPRRAERASGEGTDTHGDPLPAGALARLGTVRFRTPEGATFLSFLPGDTTLLTAGGVLSTWELGTGKEVRRDDCNGNSRTFALAPDGKTLAVGTYADNPTVVAIYLRDVTTGRVLQECRGHSKWVRSLAFSADGRTLVSGSHDKSVRFWDVATGKELRRFDEPDMVLAVALSPDGKALATTCFHSPDAKWTVRLRDAATGREQRSFKADVPVFQVAFCPDGQTLLALAPNNGGQPTSTIYLWDVATGKLRQITGQPEFGYAGAFSPDGKTLATGNVQGIVLWDVATAKERRRLGKQRVGLAGLTFSGDGKLLASLGDGTIHLWDAATGQERPVPAEGHQGSVGAVVFLPDGKTLASAGRDLTLRLWEAATGRPVRQQRMPAEMTDLDGWFAPDGSTLTWREGKRVAQLDVATGKRLRAFDFPEVVFFCALSPDGNLLAA